MLAKLKITASLTVVTGLHIGAAGGFSAIGAIDSPVIRDLYTGYPMVPGSSLKGKMRTLLAKSELPEGKYTLKDCKFDSAAVCRLFGTPGDSKSSDPKEKNPHTARLQFSDAFLQNPDELIRRGGITEDKAENFITRTTGIANPRHIERVARGARFEVVWFYTVEDKAEVRADLQLLAKACKLLEMDYLGGSGTRGYGRVAFSDFKFEAFNEEFPLNSEELSEVFKDVNSYAQENI